ncbi:response regulator [Streptomyces sp. NPDC048481]|uniref:response regulator n=1 Tax=Streptomyces sp. NPDC048481 TaxID=3365557 RepID=UPI00371B5E4E
MDEGKAERVIRVVVVDDEALVRSGFELILGASEDIEVVATASGGDAVETVRRQHPDVVLLDIRMPDVDGLTVLRELRKMPAPPVVAMLTTFDADEYILTALNSGAAGFLLKDTEPEQLAHLVRTLDAGGVVLSPKASRTLLNGHPGTETAVDEEAARVRLLTPRERDVLVLVADGLSNADIGVRVHLGAGTVKGHVSAILAKLRVTSRVQAALLAQRAGLLDERPRPAADR